MRVRLLDRAQRMPERGVLHTPRGRVGLALALLVLLGVTAGPPLLGTDPAAQDLSILLTGPSGAHPLGTDQFGRDVLARLLDGGRRSLSAALVVVSGSLLIGLVVGATAAALQGAGDAVLGRFIDLALGIPALVAALAIVGTLGPGLSNLVLGLLLTGWAAYARIARGLAMRGIDRLDVLSARLAGRSLGRSVAAHVIPAVAAQLVVVATVDLGFTVVALASLSYLGLGVQPPQAEWGTMLLESQDFFVAAPWLLLAPAAVIALTVAATNLLGEALAGPGLAGAELAGRETAT